MGLVFRALILTSELTRRRVYGGYTTVVGVSRDALRSDDPRIAANCMAFWVRSFPRPTISKPVVDKKDGQYFYAGEGNPPLTSHVPKFRLYKMRWTGNSTFNKWPNVGKARYRTSSMCPSMLHLWNPGTIYWPRSPPRKFCGGK